MLDVLPLDIYMQSPPASPSQKHIEHSNTSPTIDFQEASHTTGGILHGQAQGNVFNNADADPVLDYGLKHCIGQVQVYTSHADLIIVKPNVELKHEVPNSQRYYKFFLVNIHLFGVWVSIYIWICWIFMCYFFR